MAARSSFASSQSRMTLSTFNCLLVFILLLNLLQSGCCYEEKADYALPASARYELQVKRYRTEPIRFGKRGQREPIRFGKRIVLNLNIPHRLSGYPPLNSKFQHH
uniref:COesterase domain-containing protein n=1 Tax=Steinernema glaseri TaxID=37863 RepID=A0A1I7Z2X3_9BILA